MVQNALAHFQPDVESSAWRKKQSRIEYLCKERDAALDEIQGCQDYVEELEQELTQLESGD
ncbi:TrwK protein [Leuconostoc mesenteroides]|uniref:TrwK protein n=1 Tax=Leuconostoc mesenteroides TaxID=1245 RepID=UPI0022E7799B|nr:TrwK protein [Leuconostoc mesenteroides]